MRANVCERTSKIRASKTYPYTLCLHYIMSNVEFNFLIEQIKTYTFLALPSL